MPTISTFDGLCTRYSADTIRQIGTYIHVLPASQCRDRNTQRKLLEGQLPTLKRFCSRFHTRHWVGIANGGESWFIDQIGEDHERTLQTGSARG